jgi:hypothetical protein
MPAMRSLSLGSVLFLGCASFAVAPEEPEPGGAVVVHEEPTPEELAKQQEGHAAREAWKPRDLHAVSSTGLTWKKANLTTYTSYPVRGSEECIHYSGCYWAGKFTAYGDYQKKPAAWVEAHNIASVRFDHFNKLAFHTLRLKSGRHELDVVVYDSCADTDCSGCCTRNSRETGFLIDLEVSTASRFGVYDGVVEWACVDCDADAALFPPPAKTHSITSRSGSRHGNRRTRRDATPAEDAGSANP